MPDSEPFAPDADSSQKRRLLSGGPLDDTASDRRLVAACLRGHEQAWAALVFKYRRLIYSIPLKYGGTKEDAADIFQAVCIDLFNELPRLRNTESLRAWLITVTAHKAFHWKRQEQRRRRIEEDGIDPETLESIATPPSLAQRVEREQLVREALARLSARCRELIQMLFYEHPPRPYVEVAKLLGVATGSIGFIRGRCLHKLERVLEELGF
jgi:RNA polymerase sigma factor (sigma-70 family)